MPPAKKVLLLSAAVTGGTVLLALILTTLAWPTWLTGGSCELSVEKVLFDDVQGRAEVFFQVVLPYAGELDWEFPPGGGTPYAYHASWNQNPPRFLRWPGYPSPGQLIVPLGTKGEKPLVERDLELFRSRWVLKPGTYRLRPGEELVYFAKTDPGGRVISSFIRFRSGR
jgi:hypothetical protein